MTWGKVGFGTLGMDGVLAMLGCTSGFAASMKKELRVLMTHVFYNWLGMYQHQKLTVIQKESLLTTLKLSTLSEPKPLAPMFSTGFFKKWKQSKRFPVIEKCVSFLKDMS